VVDKEVLTRLPLFASLDDATLTKIAPWFTPRTVSEHTDLTGEGASGYSFFVMVDGSANVTRAGEKLAELGPGDFFGEGAIIGAGRRGATVRTSAPCEVLVMFGSEFRRLQHEHPEVAARIEETAAQRLAQPGS
jgi:CRP/FNR family transcriptional regulator, cyclic AMP receptor protein